MFKTLFVVFLQKKYGLRYPMGQASRCWISKLEKNREICILQLKIVHFRNFKIQHHLVCSRGYLRTHFFVEIRQIVFWTYPDIKISKKIRLCAFTAVFHFFALQFQVYFSCKWATHFRLKITDFGRCSMTRHWPDAQNTRNRRRNPRGIDWWHFHWICL